MLPSWYKIRAKHNYCSFEIFFKNTMNFYKLCYLTKYSEQTTVEITEIDANQARIQGAGKWKISLPNNNFFSTKDTMKDEMLKNVF